MIAENKVIEIFYMADKCIKEFSKVRQKFSLEDGRNDGKHRRNKPNRMSEKALFEMLFINGIQLVTRVRNNMRNMLMRAEDKILLRKRAVIETVNDELRNIAVICIRLQSCKIKSVSFRKTV